jgi:hypothetical protein
LSIPAPQPAAAHDCEEASVGNGVDVIFRTVSIVAGSSAGNADAIRAVDNATWGAAIEVPSYAA